MIRSAENCRQPTPLQAWPEQRVLIAAVNADTGERRAFDRESGVDLADAVIAARASARRLCPLTATTTLEGGYDSSDNADLAIGCERVLVLALAHLLSPGVWCRSSRE